MTRLDTEEPLKDFLTDILVNYKIDKYHLKMQRKNQFVKMSFYELVLFWSSSANLRLNVSLHHFLYSFLTFLISGLSCEESQAPTIINTSATKKAFYIIYSINMVFLDNPTVSSDYIRQMMTTAEQQDIVTKTAMESIIKLLIIVELDRGEKQRLYISQSIKDGIAASNKRSGRKPGQLDKMSDALREDILKYLSDRSIKQVDLMRKYNISRNTLKKYIDHISTTI